MSMIITAAEVVRFGPVHPDYPTDFVCDHIQRMEQALFRQCFLGIEFYKALKADLSDVSGVDAYSIDTVYETGEKVSYDGSVYVSQVDDNETHPADDNVTDWKLADKFESDCYNDLWNTNLKYWLAYEICFTSVDYTTYHLAAHGATRQTADATGQETVSSKELDRLKRKMRADADMHLTNMLAWMVEQTEDETSECDFSDVGEVADECGVSSCKGQPKRRGRRMYFKN